MSHHKRPTKANTDSSLSSSSAKTHPLHRAPSFQGTFFQPNIERESGNGEWRRPVRQNGMPKLHR